MCRPASFVLTKDRVFWSRKTESHTEIVSEFELHEDGSRGVNVVKIELVPPDGEDLTCDLAKWEYHLDQDRVPDWYDAAKCEKRARKVLPDWHNAKVLSDGEHEIHAGNAYAFAMAKVTAYNSSEVRAYDSSQVTAYNSSEVRAYDSSQVRAYDSSEVTAYNSSEVRAYNSSEVRAYNSSEVRAYDSSQVRAYDSSQSRRARDTRPCATIQKPSRCPHRERTRW
jgi:hypothetical protein